MPAGQLFQPKVNADVRVTVELPPPAFFWGGCALGLVIGLLVAALIQGRRS